MIPMILMAIEDDADRAFMINLYEQCHKAMYRQAYDILRDHAPCPRASCCRMPLLRPKARR